MKLIVLNMVSQRCKAALEAALTDADIKYDNVELGTAELLEGLSDEKREQLKTSLQKAGLELHEDKNTIAIGKIKSVVTRMINDPDLPALSY
jgi:sugar phosphate isomerase/epimerase